ncbi:unnamed protein product [Amoebophrya sp. A25]|nr:unnamed protein product [Amoebophrya sp. A25]|eukprot:GSA25T00020126001.1
MEPLERVLSEHEVLDGAMLPGNGNFKSLFEDILGSSVVEKAATRLLTQIGERKQAERKGGLSAKDLLSSSKQLRLQAAIAALLKEAEREVTVLDAEDGEFRKERVFVNGFLEVGKNTSKTKTEERTTSRQADGKQQPEYPQMRTLARSLGRVVRLLRQELGFTNFFVRPDIRSLIRGWKLEDEMDRLPPQWASAVEDEQGVSYSPLEKEQRRSREQAAQAGYRSVQEGDKEGNESKNGVTGAKVYYRRQRLRRANTSYAGGIGGAGEENEKEDAYLLADVDGESANKTKSSSQAKEFYFVGRPRSQHQQRFQDHEDDDIVITDTIAGTFSKMAEQWTDSRYLCHWAWIPMHGDAEYSRMHLLHLNQHFLKHI